MQLQSKQMLTKWTNFLTILLNVSQENHQLNFQVLKVLSNPY